MKTLVICILFIAVTVQSYAQKVDPETLFIHQKIEKYHRMKGTGRMLTVGGSVLTVIGIVMASNSSTTTTYNGSGSTNTSTEGNPGGAAACLLLGSAGLGAGIPLWIVGSHAEDKYKAKLLRQTVSFNLKANRNVAGVAITLKF